MSREAGIGLWIGVVVACALAGPAGGEVAYTVTDLGTFGGTGTSVRAANNAGQVIGRVSETPPPPWRYLWDPQAGVTNLNALLGADASPRDINDLGHIVYGAHLGVPEELHAFLWHGSGSPEYLGPFWPRTMNNTGMVVGNLGPSSWPRRAAVWDRDHSLRDIGPLPGGEWTYPYDVNDLGEVVGRSTTGLTTTGHPFLHGEIDPEVQNHPFLWSEARGMQDLGTLGGDFAWARGINDLSQVVGLSYVGGDTGVYRAFLWDDVSGMHDLGCLPGHDCSEAFAINESGEVVGRSGQVGGERVAFVWDEVRGMRALRDLVPASVGWESFYPVDINERGQIVGGADFEDPEDGRVSRALILTPVPEPTALALTLYGSWVLIRKRNGLGSRKHGRREPPSE